MSSRASKEQVAVGEDSFLDTTANLVGILIILVVVIGTKTKMDAEAYSQKIAATDASSELEAPRREAMALLEALEKQKQELRQYELESEYRKSERDRLLTQVTQARAIVDEQLEASDSSQVKLISQTKQIQELESKLSDIAQQMGAAEDSKRPEIVLEHLPTPMAKTVFTKEMHVQLKNHQVTVIPWDRLVSMLKERAPLLARRGASRTKVEDTLGPVGGFLMRYRMNAVPGGFELERFELECLENAPSESLQESLEPAGRLRLELASRNPAETVVTVWVFEDSFEEYRQLKARMFEEGFLSAARPLPEGMSIGASPHGTRSSAQ